MSDLSPDAREAQIMMQRASMQYGEIHYESGGFEPGVITGWFGTANMAKTKPATAPNPFQPRPEQPVAAPVVVVVQDVNTPVHEQQARIIPLARVIFVDQAPSS